MSSGLTVVAICRSLGALHCFPRSRGRRAAVPAASRAEPNQQRTHFALTAFCGVLPLPSTCPLLPQMVWGVNWEEKAKDEQRAETIFPPQCEHSSGWQIPKGLAWPLSVFWDMSPQASSDGQRAASPCHHHLTLAESFNHQDAWNEAVLAFSREPSPHQLQPMLCQLHPVYLPGSAGTLQSLKLGGKYWRGVQLSARSSCCPWGLSGVVTWNFPWLRCHFRQINMLQYLVGFWLDLKFRIRVDLG